ncbi:MAG: aminotransferase class I/II-fold pyridoxal phosphate-dependent enzyme [Chlamydiales bacterium]
MKPSATGAISSKAQEMRGRGIRVYNFAAGDPVLQNHPLLIEAAQTALRDGYCPYAPIAGLIDLRLAAAHWMNRRYKSSFILDEAVVTAGGKFGIYAALQILLKEGDEAIIPSPYWVSYPEMVRMASGTAVFVQTRWKLTPEQLREAITDKTRVLILNNGCNPTGVLYSRSEIAALLKIAIRADLTVISDEVYSELVYDGAEYVSCASFPEYRSNLLIIESCSKNFAMAGWRVGFAFGPQKLISELIALQSQSTTGASFFSQKIALAALKHSDEIGAYVRSAMDRRRKLFFETYNRLMKPSVELPQAAVYYFIKVDRCEEILEKAHVALVPGEAFGVDGYGRLDFTETEEEIVQGLEALSNQKNGGLFPD